VSRDDGRSWTNGLEPPLAARKLAALFGPGLSVAGSDTELWLLDAESRHMQVTAPPGPFVDAKVWSGPAGNVWLLLRSRDQAHLLHTTVGRAQALQGVPWK
jgi:hypothetical protein